MRNKSEIITLADPREMEIEKFIFDKQSISPVYLQLANQILNALKYGNFDLHKPLPSSVDFERKLGISSTTVFRAYTQLHRNGVVRWKKNFGFFCIEKPQSEKIPLL